MHENVVRNYVNIELFHADDQNKEDCLGWISLMEKCDGNLRTELKNEKLTLKERKNIAMGIEAGLNYLNSVGILHRDQKLSNFLLIGDVPKVCDFGHVTESSLRESYRKLGYARKGSKFEKESALCKLMTLKKFLAFI